VSEPTWRERLFGGFRKTTERLSENLTGVVGTAKLDNATLDEVEDALILSDLGPSAAARICARLSEKRFGLTMTDRELKEAVAEEIAAILRPVAKPLEVTAFPRPQVVLVIGVNGSGKTTTIAKLAHDWPAQDLGRSHRRADRHRSRGRGFRERGVRRSQTGHCDGYRRADRRHRRPVAEQARADG
jgi:fused signal recognition particle receptor